MLCFRPDSSTCAAGMEDTKGPQNKINKIKQKKIGCMYQNAKLH